MVSRALLWSWMVALVATGSSACESVLDLNDAQLITVQPTLEEAAGPLCREYCEAVMANCVGSFQVYANSVQCLNLCRAMAPGTAGDLTGNTLQCRLSNARLALETAEPESHCPQAGPGGAAAPVPAESGGESAAGPSCSTNCEGLCSAMLAICPEQYTSLPGCLEECAVVPDLGGYNISVGQGNSVQCRLFHLGAAAAAPDPHCLHAAGASPCR
jgi:hypothetical protein